MWRGVWDQRCVSREPQATESCAILSKTLVWTFGAETFRLSFLSEWNTWKFTREVYTRVTAITLLHCASFRGEPIPECRTVFFLFKYIKRKWHASSILFMPFGFFRAFALTFILNSIRGIIFCLISVKWQAFTGSGLETIHLTPPG